MSGKTARCRDILVAFITPGLSSGGQALIAPWPNIIGSFLRLNIYSGLIDVLFSAMESSCCGAPDPRLSSLADFPLRSLPLGPNVEEEGAVFGLDCTANLSNHQRQGTMERDRLKQERKKRDKWTDWKKDISLWRFLTYSLTRGCSSLDIKTERETIENIAWLKRNKNMSTSCLQRHVIHMYLQNCYMKYCWKGNLHTLRYVCYISPNIPDI